MSGYISEKDLYSLQRVIFKLNYYIYILFIINLFIYFHKYVFIIIISKYKHILINEKFI